MKIIKQPIFELLYNILGKKSVEIKRPIRI